MAHSKHEVPPHEEIKGRTGLLARHEYPRARHEYLYRLPNRLPISRELPLMQIVTRV